MDEQKRIELLQKAKDFFLKEIVTSHVRGGLKKAGSLSNYNVNPFLFKYLANFLRGNGNPESMAEALILPRVLGSSITTTFGMKIQKLIGELFEGFGSTTSGIDIEFIDAIDGRKKYCQIKSGPNTINHDDVQTIFGHFDGIINLARTNNLNVGFQDLMVGIIYGEKQDLSSHYKSIDQRFPVFIGKDFWHHLTGKEDFYYDLIDAFGEVALEVDGGAALRITIQKLAREIEVKFK